MRLQKAQREALISWIADGAQSDEIRLRAAAFEPPFSITRSLVEYYRTRDGVKVTDIIAADQGNALNTGLALKENRVAKLKSLAERIEAEVIDRLWIPDVKGVGSGEAAQVVDFEYFNKSGVDAYRGTLDDIAAETGGRVVKQEHTGAGGKDLIPAPIEKTDDQLSNTLAKLAEIAGNLALASGAGVPRNAGGPAGGDTSSESGG